MDVESGSGGGGGVGGGEGVVGDDSSTEACVIKDEIEDTCSSGGGGGTSGMTDEDRTSGKFVLPNELYKSLLASAVLGKTVLGRHHPHVTGSFNSAINSALKELKDIKGLTVSSVPVFPRNLAALRGDEFDEVCLSLRLLRSQHPAVCPRATSVPGLFT